MAKRRNAKKEKAARNKINARKFRKPSSRYSGRGRRYSNYNNNEQKSTETETNKSESTAKTENNSQS